MSLDMSKYFFFVRYPPEVVIISSPRGISGDSAFGRVSALLKLNLIDFISVSMVDQRVFLFGLISVTVQKEEKQQTDKNRTRKRANSTASKQWNIFHQTSHIHTNNRPRSADKMLSFL